jgi:hypothetical protein
MQVGASVVKDKKRGLGSRLGRSWLKTRPNHFLLGVRYKVGSTAPSCSRNVSTVYGLVSAVSSELRISRSNARVV